jgi:D-glycero-D-manno-heptose 1,7-bisphosphate phosphatase
MQIMRPGILLDRDGVINENRPDHVKCWSEFEFLPGTLDALRSLAALGLPIAVVTNQSVIGRGLASQAAIDDINDRMLTAVRAAGGRIDGVWYCPHAPDAGCDCRKPASGLLVAAAAALNFDLHRSFLVGDAVSDMQAALAVGAYPIMVRTGRGVFMQPQARALDDLPEFALVDDLQAAVDWVYCSIETSVSNCVGDQ